MTFQFCDCINFLFYFKIKMELKANKCVGNISVEQKILLMEFKEKNPNLVKGNFTQQFTFKSAQYLWPEITVVLNGVPGAKKDWKQWRKTWQDMRSKAKKIKAEIRNNTGRTGGGKFENIALDATNDRVCNIIGDNSILGDKMVEESQVQFEFEEVDGDNENAFNVRHLVDCETSQKFLCDSVNTAKSGTEVNEENDGSEDTDTNTRKRKNLPSVRGTKNPKRSIPSQRLERSIAESSKIVEVSQRDFHIRKDYYNKKLELLEMQIIAYERIAAATEKLTENIEKFISSYN